MDDYSVRRRAFALVAFGAVVGLTACQDKRVKELNTGITRDSAVSVLATEIKGGGHDSFPNVYTRDRYLIDGKNYEVLYFTANNEKAGKDSVPRKNLVPLVFVDNVMIGKGWDVWDSVSKAHKIAIPPR